MFQLILIGGGCVVGLLAVLAVVPNPFRQGIRDTFSILFGKLLGSATSEIERAEQQVARLETQIKQNEHTASDLRGTLNHEKNKLTATKEDLKKTEADYQLAKEDKLGEATENDCLDKIGIAEEAVHTQELVVEDIQKSVDATRLAVAKAAKELKGLQNKVKSKAARAKATSAIKSAATVLETSKDISKTTGELGRDLDKIDEQYEQAKARFEDSQGSDAERKLEEAKAKRERDAILKRMQDRNKPTTPAAQS
jgi:phage shock protein A